MSLSPVQKRQINILAQTDISIAEIARQIGARKVHVDQYLSSYDLAISLARKHEQKRQERSERLWREKRQAAARKILEARAEAATCPEKPVFVTRSGIVAVHHKSVNGINAQTRQNKISLPALSFLEGE